MPDFRNPAFLSNPLFSLGIGILAQDPRNSTGQNIGQGLITGAQLFQQFRANSIREQAAQYEAQRRLEDENRRKAQEQARSEYFQNSPPDVRQLSQFDTGAALEVQQAKQMQAQQQEQLSNFRQRFNDSLGVLQEGGLSLTPQQQALASRILGSDDLKTARATEDTFNKTLNSGVDGADEVQSSKILPGGVTHITYKSGRTEVKKVDELSADIIRRAEDRGVFLQEERAKGRTFGTGAAKLSAEVEREATRLRHNNLKLREVIKTVDAGADTGPLAKRLPSIRAQAVRLDNLRFELGLDIVGAVTFGALSEGELQLALDTALPTGLQGEELKKWATSRIDAQEKLASYLEDQAIFLSKRGNNVPKWLEYQKSKAQGSVTTQQQINEGQVIVNPQTGQRLILKGGQWQPL